MTLHPPRSGVASSVVVCVGLALVGCNSTPPPDHVVLQPQVDLRTKPDQVVVIQPQSRVVGTAGDMQVVGLKTITVNGQLTVEATVSNQRGRRDILYYRLRWLDATGVMLGQYAPWLTEAIDGLQQTVITVPSPYASAQDFRLEIHGHE